MLYKFYLAILTISALLIAECNAIPDSSRKLSRQEYIENYARLAIEEMNEYHIPASIILAQACLESSDGNSTLARISNNHFGIKCKSTWAGQTVTHDDDERNECFRKYDSPMESFRDHSRFLMESDRYQFLFNYDITDYRNWARGLKKAGYATDPSYPDRLIRIIEDFQLNELDRYYKGGINYAGIKRRGFNPGKGSSGISNSARRVYERNRSRAFYARPGDTYEKIAMEFDMKEWEIFKYNDCVKGSLPEENSIVYIRSKKGKAPRGNEYHLFREGESMWSIAQWYGVRLNALYRINKMKKSDEPFPGQKISLRKKVRK
jgi:hypothetical protein